MNLGTQILQLALQLGIVMVICIGVLLLIMVCISWYENWATIEVEFVAGKILRKRPDLLHSSKRRYVDIGYDGLTFRSYKRALFGKVEEGEYFTVCIWHLKSGKRLLRLKKPDGWKGVEE
jgi:hypothetical protein